jgi:hypothetical protein
MCLFILSLTHFNISFTHSAVGRIAKWTSNYERVHEKADCGWPLQYSFQSDWFHDKICHNFVDFRVEVGRKKEINKENYI